MAAKNDLNEQRESEHEPEQPSEPAAHNEQTSFVNAPLLERWLRRSDDTKKEPTEPESG